MALLQWEERKRQEEEVRRLEQTQKEERERLEKQIKQEQAY